MNGSRFKGLEIFWVSIVMIFSTAGCALVPAPTRSIHVGQSDRLGECADFFSTLDERVVQAGAIEAYPFRVKSYPYLRVDRFLASFAADSMDKAEFETWVVRMQQLDQVARSHEIANLVPDGAPGAENDPSGLLRRVTACGDLLKTADFSDLRNQLPETVSAPDDYIQLRRVAGLYPLTRLFIAAGVLRWHAEARKSFSTMPPPNWQTWRYRPPPVHKVPQNGPIPNAARRDALGVPEYDTADLQSLFRFHAPVWEIQQGAEADRIGKPHRDVAGQLAVDTDEPVAYKLLSFTRFEQRVHPQLNYFIWFPERPKQHPLDLFGGLLDGLIYRVTLDNDGAPLLYETVHSCGCYYKAYPTDRLRPLDETEYAEPPLILSAPRLSPTQEVMTIAMESHTHYVRHLYPLARQQLTGARDYPLADYALLGSLAAAGGQGRSMFGQDGLVPGTGRLERFVLWPTGVLSPGAMRQWGRHAVAFAGKRHFDDPHYLDKMFQRR